PGAARPRPVLRFSRAARIRAATGMRHTRDAHWLRSGCRVRLRRAARKAASNPDATRWTHSRRRAAARSSPTLPEFEHIESQDLALNRCEALLPMRHMSLPAVADRRHDRLQIAAVNPVPVGEVGSA